MLLSPDLGQWIVAPISAALGLASGSGMSYALHRLRHGRADSLVRADDLVGLSAKVDLPLSAGQRGRVRVRVKGTLVDYTAHTDELRELEAGEEVLIVGMEGAAVRVVRLDELSRALPDPAGTRRKP